MVLLVNCVVGPALDALHKDLLKLKAAKFDNDKNILPLKKNILLNNIDYNYPNSSRTALKNLHLTIPARSTVGIVGATGSGKTTTVDIILGLLKAQKGSLQIDGQVISENNIRAWQRTIGYVPQQIYLADDSIASNIAFGIDYKDINQNKVERAAKIANLHDFVVKELPNKYKTTVGERGIRLSGGQRQRIGIARALYNNPQVLIFDEATSALDNLTEQIVMDSVHNIGSDITIILIAHRLSTVKECDTIFLLEKGELKAEGTFENLIKMSESFRKSAKRI
jgi:ABC-type multidrug transport system fused ATPase/permease subunit